jgi:hypothetical protein
MLTLPVISSASFSYLTVSEAALSPGMSGITSPVAANTEASYLAVRLALFRPLILPGCVMASLPFPWKPFLDE